MENTPVRVLVIEDHPLMRDALSTAIASDPSLELVAELTSGLKSLDVVTVLHPDILLIALGNPGPFPDNLETLAALHVKLPELPIVALVTGEVPGQEAAALNAGAQVALAKSVSREGLLKALHGVAAGHVSNEIIQNTEESLLEMKEANL